jgi:hypothetical protein
MWARIAFIILRNRFLMLGILGAITAFMAYMAISRIQINHQFQTMLPESDTVNIVFQDMKHRFGEDGMVMVIGIKEKDLYNIEKFKAWKHLGDDVNAVDGVDSVFSVAHMYSLQLDTTNKTMRTYAMCKPFPQTQTELDTLVAKIHELPFYNGILYNDTTGASLMMVFINPNKFNSKQRGTIIPDVIAVTEKYKDRFSEFHFSGLPYIREVLHNTLKSELRLFVALSVGVTALIIFIFFRSIRVLIACLVVVFIGVIWSFGTMGVLGFHVSQLMALIPPLMIVIAIPNCIYLITKYHQEFKKSGNKMRALSSIIQKIGAATLMTNATTAVGFATFILTDNEKLYEFGVVSAINVMALFFLSLIIIPIVFSFMKDPSVKQTKHLEKGWVEWAVETLVNIVSGYRKWVFAGSILLVGLSIWGMSMIKTTGAITEDLPPTSKVVVDLRFIEDNFGGMVPYEIMIDFKNKAQLKNPNYAIKNLHKVDSIQRVLETKGVFSKSLSVTDALKFVNQAFNGGNKDFYFIPEKGDLMYMRSYFEGLLNKKNGPGLKGFIDSTETRGRITLQVKDLGASKLTDIEKELAPQIDGILNPDRHATDSAMQACLSKSGPARDTALIAFYDEHARVYNYLIDELSNGDSLKKVEFENDPAKVYAHHKDGDFNVKLKKAVNLTYADVYITGTAVAFAKGTQYLIGNLVSSLIFAVVLISALMALLFRSWRMVLISMIPNLVPLIITAGVMGFFGVPIKVSTVLVFSIALGISVDDAIHYLAKYRQDLKQGKSIGEAAIISVRESGVSMMYTSIVLFCGFMMFTFSEFGGTKALGMLISLTLFVAMFCNLIILPSLLMSLNKLVTTKAFREPYLDVFDEEIDEDLSGLHIEKKPDSDLN